jgi:hypothetical protein
MERKKVSRSGCSCVQPVQRTPLEEVQNEARWARESAERNTGRADAYRDAILMFTHQINNNNAMMDAPQQAFPGSKLGRY